MKRFSFKYADTTLYFGLNAVENLKNYINGYEHVTIVTGKSSAKLSGALKDVEFILKDFNVSYNVFDKIEPNPTVECADELAYEIWRNSSDAVIAIGGGSVIDTAKVASVIALSGGSAREYLRKKKVKGALPLYAVNLTHGTGSEIDRFAVLTDGNEKIGISIRYPTASFDDPKYTLTLPRNQAIYTAIDAFFHAYEAVTAKSNNPLAELFAFKSAEIIGNYLPKEHGLEEKYWLLYASMLAGIALDLSPAHIVHAIEHALSGINPKLAHGCGLAIVGSRCIYWIHKHSKNSAKILKCLTGKDVKSAEEAEKAFKEFLSSLGFSETLSDYGFSQDDFKEVEKIVFSSLRYLLERVEFKFTAEMLRDILSNSL